MTFIETKTEGLFKKSNKIWELYCPLGTKTTYLHETIWVTI
jgi:hypothetical protein